jgi:hypothetical protein
MKFTLTIYQEDSTTVSRVLEMKTPVRLKRMRIWKGDARTGVEALVLRGIFACIAIVFVALPVTSSTKDVPNLKQVLERVQDHVSEFEHGLPDFICDETITSRELWGGKVKHETIVDSAFMGRQTQVESGRPFTESRDIRTINGRPAPQGQELKAPFLFEGGFSSTLVEIFARENAPYFNYSLSGTELLEGQTALVIKFETRNRQKKLLYRDLFGQRSYLNGRGKAWIDPESMNVIRLELHYLDPPAGEGELQVSIDYAAVTINDKTFWMPRLVTAEQTIPNAKIPVGGQYVAEYSNYHHFKVSHKISAASP